MCSVAWLECEWHPALFLCNRMAFIGRRSASAHRLLFPKPFSSWLSCNAGVRTYTLCCSYVSEIVKLMSHMSKYPGLLCGTFCLSFKKKKKVLKQSNWTWRCLRHCTAANLKIQATFCYQDSVGHVSCSNHHVKWLLGESWKNKADQQIHQL